MARIGLIGYGSIGRAVLAQLRDSGRAEDVVGVLVRPERVAELVAQGIPAVGTLTELTGRGPDIVAEVAGQAAVAEYGAGVLEAGCDLLVVSIGALADPELDSRLRAAAAAAARRVILCAGAIGGIDAISAMRLAGLRRVTYRSRKPPAAWKGTPAEQAADLDALAAPLVFYRGSAREAALGYPKNANVAATVALAGLGFEATSVELVADPTVSGNLHEIEAEGASGMITIALEGRPSPENPKTSMLTALSVARELLGRSATVVI